MTAVTTSATTTATTSATTTATATATAFSSATLTILAMPRQLDVGHCPVTREALSHGLQADTDWSIDRLNNPE